MEPQQDGFPLAKSVYYRIYSSLTNNYSPCPPFYTLLWPTGGHGLSKQQQEIIATGVWAILFALLYSVYVYFARPRGAGEIRYGFAYGRAAAMTETRRLAPP
jgi:hypothetical protein